MIFLRKGFFVKVLFIGHLRCYNVDNEADEQKVVR